MAQNFVLDPVAQVAAILLDKDLILGTLAARDFEGEFTGGVGSTVTYRKPAVLAARTRALGATTAITVDDVTEASGSVAISEHVYQAAALPQSEETLNVRNYAEQVVGPQVDAMARYIENALATRLATITANAALSVGGGSAYNGATPRVAFAALRRLLREAELPADRLTAVVGTAVYEDLLLADVLKDTDRNGDAVLHGEVGSLAGFRIIEHNGIDADDIFAGDFRSLQLVTRAPLAAPGVENGQASANGVGLRLIRGFNMSTLVTTGVAEVFMGSALVPFKDSAGSDVAGIVRVTTA